MLAILRTKRTLYISIAAAVIAVAVFAGFMLSGRNQSVLAGQNIVVTVIADSLEDAYGYQFQMNYDKEQVEYIEDTGTLTSKISDIQMIFSKPFSGYELVGATMTGEKSGVSGKNKAVCEMVFIAKKDSTLADLSISISDVNVVKTGPEDFEYIEDIEGWKLKYSVQT